MGRGGSRRSGFGGSRRRSYGSNFSFFGNNKKSKSPPKKSIIRSNLIRKAVSVKKKLKIN